MNSRFMRPVLGRFPKALFALSLAAWVFAGSSALAKGGGGGGGHGGGGHGGGGHSGGHSGGGYHGGGYHGGGYHGGGYHGGYTRHYYPGGGSHGGYSGFYFPGLYLGGYGYGYGYSNSYYPYGYGYGYSDPSYTYQPSDVYPGTTGNNYYVEPNASASSTVVQPPGPQGAMLGIDEAAVVDATGSGMRVEKVYAGSAAERAGLQVGDVIRSANGYLTQVHGNLTWIINNQAANGVLNLVVHRAADGRDVTVVAQLP